MLRLASLALIALSASTVSAASIDALVNDQSVIDTVNQAATTWQAHPNSFFEGKTLSHAKRLMGTRLTPSRPDQRLPLKLHAPADEIPESFDVREKWGSMCPDLHQVRDQGNCGSCWAVSFGAVASGRACIASNGTFTKALSSADPLSCCSSSGCAGCDGGELADVWDYYRHSGVVTGDEYETNTGLCYDYPIANCEHHVENSTSGLPSCGSDSEPEAPTPMCPFSCPSTPALNWKSDKHYASHVYRLPDEESMQRDMMKNGPLQVAFTVFGDFMTYKSGIYQHVTGEELGGHAVTLTGWGVENGTAYWTCVNNWRASWGDQGSFRIVRGQNECGIEEFAYGGVSLE